MPVYYPDLESVKSTCEDMLTQEKGKEYRGIIPQTEDQLVRARVELGKYFREVWHDEIAALEVENSVTEDNYDEKLSEAIRKTWQ